MKKSDACLELICNESILEFYSKNISKVNDLIKKLINSDISEQKIFDDNKDIAYRLVAYSSNFQITIEKSKIIILANESIIKSILINNISDLFIIIFSKIFNDCEEQKKFAYRMKYSSILYKIDNNENINHSYKSLFRNEYIDLKIKNTNFDNPTIEFNAETTHHEEEAYDFKDIIDFIKVIGIEEIYTLDCLFRMDG